MTFKPLFGQITILSLSLVTFRVFRFPVSYLTHETVKLCLQNTLNMSKTTRVYFGVLHTKLVGNFVEVQKTINAQLRQKMDIMENIVDKRIDGLQSEMEYKLDNLQYSISMLTNQQHVHKEEVNPKEECLIDTTVEEQCKNQKEETSPMLTEEGSGKEEIEKPQKSTAQATNSPLSEEPSPDLVYTTPAAHSNPKAPTTKASLALPVLKNLKKLVATVQAYATTSKTLAIAYVAWHSGWFGCWFGFRAPEPRHF